MKYVVASLERKALRTAVALAEGFEVIGLYGDSIIVRTEPGQPTERYAPDRHYAHGGPIIERELIEISPIENGRWSATAYEPVSYPDGSHSHLHCEGNTPLIAAMRVYIASKFGDEVELP